MESPLVSVITPCYNQAQYLGEAVQSILDSGYDNVEIIVVDDGSDGAGQQELLRGFSAPKTRIIHQPNQGPCAARNAAIRASPGKKYVLPLDADDRTAAGFIPEAVRVLESEPEATVVSGWIQEFGHTDRLHKSAPCQSVWDEMHYNRLPSSSMFRRSDWDKTDGYPEDMRYGLEDWELWIAMLGKTGGHTVQLDRVAVHYRIHNSSLFRDLMADTARKRQMLACIVRRHLDDYLSRPDVLADFIYRNYNMGNEPTPLLPPGAERMLHKYLKYKKLSNLLLVASSVLAVLLAAGVLLLIHR